MLIVDCRNLIGDTIYLIKPLRQFLASRRLEEVALAVGDGLPGDIVRRSFPGVRIDRIDVLEAAWPDAERITLSAAAAWQRTRSDDTHTSIGYARVLGIELSGGIEPDVAWLPPCDPGAPRQDVVLAPFSISCTGNHGGFRNKTLSEEDWAPLLDLLRPYGRLRIVCGPGERFSAAAGFAESDYFTASNLEELIAVLRRSRLVVGIDTGICHVSSCAAIPTVVLWSSAANLNFIGETWAPRTRIVPIGKPAEFDACRVAGLLEEAAAALLPGAVASPEPDPGAAPSSIGAGGHLVFPALDAGAFLPVVYRPAGLRNWSGHLPFARDLVASLRPRLLVELGTLHGESYFGFCQALAESGIQSSCYAVNEWRDASAGGEETYAEVERHNFERYAGFSHLLRMTFDDALGWFARDSIDLLHIDGPRSYDAVKRHFEAWWPKVAPGGIVLLHDVTERYAGFGVWKLWEELRASHDSFEFHHSHGLGVIRKAGGERAGGILDYLFAPANAEAIRRYYTFCADWLESKKAPRQAVSTGETSPVFTDPGSAAVEALTGPPAPDAVEGGFFSLSLDDPDLSRVDWTPVEGQAGTWLAATQDPHVVCKAGFDASVTRFFVLVMACSCEEAAPSAQLFWTGPERPGFNERLAVRIPLVPDGRPHAYIVDLHAGAGLGALNELWRHHGEIEEVRFDPLDVPGEFTISTAGFAHEDRIEAPGVRESLGLPPLRTELSYRYLRGSGLEIGALQNPLPLRPDAYVRYLDRLTVEQARAGFPELAGQELVTPAIICDAAALDPFPDASVDFVIANHVIENLRNPLGGLCEWIRILRPGGHLYMAVPEHTNPLDRLRTVTELDHLVADYNDRDNRSAFDREHYTEWVAATRPDLPEEERAQYEAELIARDYAIHFHTFSRESLSAMLRLVESNFLVEQVEFRRTYGRAANEFIAILRKR